MEKSKESGRVAVLMGSASDEKAMEKCFDYLDYFGIASEKHIISAHRNPEALEAFCAGIEENNIEVIIAGAGMAAHLPGVIASKTVVPVIGVPLGGSALNGVDALYSIVQMPPGIPVATVAIGSAGARNGAVLAAEILALKHDRLKTKLVEFRKQGSKL
jgi:phosphoribosylaminoimidazole carboxylase PurE protein